MILLRCFTLYSFPFMSFLRISHERFLMRQCAHKNISISLFFSWFFLQRDIRNIKYVGFISPNLSHWVVRLFHNRTRLEPSFFTLDFEGLYMSIGHQLSKGNY
jgi:hypothetical protein